MNKLRAIFAFAALSAVAAFGQDRTVWRTSADVQEGGRGTIVGTVADTQNGRNRMIVTPDNALSGHRRYGRGFHAVQRLRRNDQRSAGDFRRRDRLQ